MSVAGGMDNTTPSNDMHNFWRKAPEPNRKTAFANAKFLSSSPPRRQRRMCPCIRELRCCRLAIARRETPSYGAAAVAVPVLMLFLLVQQLRWLLYRCSESVAAAVIMADGQIAHARDERFINFAGARGNGYSRS